jgi:sugar phosphate isomerase/epimerase
MQKIGVIHYNFPGFDFDRYLRFAADNGYGFVELGIGDVWPEGENDPEERAKAVRQKVNGLGLRVSALGAGNDFLQPTEELEAAQIERMIKVGQITRLLDEEAVIRAEGGWEKESVSPEQWPDKLYRCFSRMSEQMMMQGLWELQIAIDNHGTVTNDPAILLTLLRRVNSRNLGANLDTMNFRWFGHSIEKCNQIYDEVAIFAKHTHMKDGFGSRREYKGAALGEGEVDLAHALAALSRASYQGVYCAEYEGPEAAEGVGYAKCARWLKANIPG